MSHNQSAWSVRVPGISRNLSVEEVEKVKFLARSTWGKVVGTSKKVAAVAGPAAALAACVTAVGVCLALEVVANASADAHDYLVKKTDEFANKYTHLDSIKDSDGQEVK